jgi:hypothetical protein
MLAPASADRATASIESTAEKIIHTSQQQRLTMRIINSIFYAKCGYQLSDRRTTVGFILGL